MRKYNLLAVFAFIMALAFQGCRGPEGIPGPQGPEGPQGPAGPEILPVVFQVRANFSSDGDYRNSYTFPNDLEIYPDDIVQVYLLYNMASVNGNEVPVWRALPQVIPAGNGFFQYNFDYTQYDVEFFLDGNIDLATLEESWTKDQIFRVAVLPAIDITNGRTGGAAIDLTNYEEVVNAYGIDESKIKEVTLN